MKPIRLLASLLLASCIAVPRTEVIYDPQCQVRFKQMSLDLHDGAGLRGPAWGCRSGTECLVGLALIGGISAASVVISGSIVVIGNTVYWLEKKGRCLASPVPPLLAEPAEFSPDPAAEPLL